MKVVGTIVMEPAVYDCNCCQDKFFNEVLVYHNGTRKTIHCWQLADVDDLKKENKELRELDIDGHTYIVVQRW